MVCEVCASVAAENRKIFNRGGKAWWDHPLNCGCTCQHRLATKWDEYFSVKEPDGEDS